MGFLRKFMYGRYGADQLGYCTIALYLILYLLGSLTRWGFFHLLSFAMAILTLYRMLSRNIPRRSAENQRFLSLTAPARSWWRTRNMKRTDKEHKYFKCPNCGQQLRVPRVSGTVKITCRSCGTVFEEKIK